MLMLLNGRAYIYPKYEVRGRYCMTGCVKMICGVQLALVGLSLYLVEAKGDTLGKPLHKIAIAGQSLYEYDEEFL